MADAEDQPVAAWSDSDCSSSCSPSNVPGAEVANLCFSDQVNLTAGGNGGSGKDSRGADLVGKGDAPNASGLADLPFIDQTAASRSIQLENINLSLSLNKEQEVACMGVADESESGSAAVPTPALFAGCSTLDLTSPMPEQAVALSGTYWPVWKYFKLPAGVPMGEAMVVYCILCNAAVKRGRPGNRSVGAAALESHLAHQHKIFWWQTPAEAAAAAAAAATTTANDTTTNAAALPTIAAAVGSHSSAMPQQAAVARDALFDHKDWLLPPHDQHVFLGVCMQACQYCGKVLSCGETLLEPVLQAARRHIRTYHPERYLDLAETDRAEVRKQGKKKRSEK